MLKFTFPAALTLIASVVFSCPAFSQSSLPRQNLQVEVIDGDTLRVKGSKQSIRLFGVDSCEKD
jgi:endonuclease YncB( thermonuclease family)